MIDFLLTGAAVDATNIHETADKTATETPMDVGETNQDQTEKGKLLVSSSICAHTSSIAY